ncbi:tRNA (adenosine(37)-N6)-threonylcarbamoyltransferase complex ATPase subunit type 1 TsaE [Candidatus Saccharibacteria bacterium]|nr:MAG: tRNA (adenosine(37)-N6)-threonylcarbamoyltransferase complex ATPase subunit type 1 TsaE [Candidatus Saccharibacteria bacterium]
MRYSVKTSSANETTTLGQKVGAVLRGTEVFKLKSDLGGGKTTFVKGLANGLGADETVQSPTFIISAQYHCERNLELHHYDFYRLQDLGIMQEQLDESLLSPSVVTVMEWGDSADTTGAKDLIEVTIAKDPVDENARQVTFEVPDVYEYIATTLEGKS